ncbi:MAG: hypothetical protein RLZZ332_1631, partial [Actinomycetota bacterium]
MRTFGFLPRRICANGGTTEDGTSIDYNIAVIDRNGKAIHATWCGAALL